LIGLAKILNPGSVSLMFFTGFFSTQLRMMSHKTEVGAFVFMDAAMAWDDETL
jgi:hypothetical protein